MVADLAWRARWLERNRRRIAIVVGAIAAVVLWFALPRWMGPDWPVIHARFTALVAATLIHIAVDFVLSVTTAWWEVQVGRAARAGDLPHAIVVERTKP